VPEGMPHQIPNVDGQITVMSFTCRGKSRGELNVNNVSDTMKRQRPLTANKKTGRGDESRPVSSNEFNRRLRFGVCTAACEKVMKAFAIFLQGAFYAFFTVRSAD
jgi:hypothetical protein